MSPEQAGRDQIRKSSSLNGQSEKTASRPSSITTPDSVCQEEQRQLAAEGSWAAVSQIIVAFFIAFNTWGLTNAFGVFQTYYVRSGTLRRSNSDIAWIGSLQASLILFILVMVGPLFDRGLARWLITSGLFLNVFGMMMTSLASQYWQLMLCQGLCVGCGLGCLFIVAIGQIALTFKRRRWLALGLAQSGGSIGAIIYSEMFRQLQPAVGFGWATRAIAFVMLATLLVSTVLLRPHKLEKPREMFDANAFRNPPFNFFAVSSFTGFMGLYIPFFYIQRSVFGRIVPGFVADELGLLNTYSVCSVGATAFAFLWVACHSLGGTVVFTIFYGFFSGCVAALQPAVLASLAPTPNTVGTWVGMGSLFSSTGLLIGNPLGGLILDHSGWVPLQLWCGCMMTASTLATLGTRVARGGSGPRTKV